MIGQTISHYKILEKLGEGGMGVVYKAQDTKLDRIVALKFLPKSLLCDSEAKIRFEHEAKAASALDHPNIGTIYEIDEVEDECFISMAHIEGKSIKELLKEKTFSMEEVLNIAIQIAEGLNAAHKKGIVHRDIKSDNLMLTNDGLVKIMDFGLAKLKGVSRLTRTGSTLGTLAYTSPEQAQDMELDQRSDIFSFGVVLYEMITEQLPFKGEHQAAIIYSILNETPEPLARYKANVPEGLQRVVDKAMAKDRDERYQNVNDLLADLRREKKSLEYVGTAVATKPAESPKPAIAVLYLQNFSENKEDAYFAAGMTEDIITQLSKISGLRVRSRNDVEQFKNKPVNLKEAADRLRVSYVMEGSVRKYGNKIRITCQLIKASDGFHVWADSYDRQMEDLFAIQADVAKAVAWALKVVLIPAELEKIEKKPTLNVQAYDYYLQGREYYFGGGSLQKERLELSTEMFGKALIADSNFALAYAGLSDCYSSYVMNYVDPKRSWLNEAEKAAQKALTLDPNLAEAHRSLSRLYWVEGKTEKSVQEAEEAVKANPNYGEAWRVLGQYYTLTGQYPKAESALMRALEVKPTETILFAAIIDLYSAWGKKEKAEEYFNKGLEIQPQSGYTYFGMSSYYLFQGDLGEAERMAHKAMNADPHIISPLLNLIQIFMMSDDPDTALHYINKYRRQNPGQDLFVELGYLELIRGNKKQAEIDLDSCIQFNRPLIKELEGLPDEYYCRLRIALAYALKGESRKALEQAERVKGSLGESLLKMKSAIFWHVVRPLSFVYSLAGQKEKAVRMLDFFVMNDLMTPAYIKLHPWYKNLAGYPAFEELTNQKTK
jgi:serine/threonine protein kinase/Tfp pilus assembly protein PilF